MEPGWEERIRQSMRDTLAEEQRLKPHYEGVVLPEGYTDWYVTCEYQIRPQVRAWRLVEDDDGYLGKGQPHIPYYKYRRLDLEAWERGETVWSEQEFATVELIS